MGDAALVAGNQLLSVAYIHESDMQIRDNQGKLIGEINTIVRPAAGVVSINTVYSGERVITQTISTRDNAGNVKTETIYGGKILP
jgi:hypothetical protein